MRSAFLQEIFQTATLGGRKKQLSRVGIVKVDFARDGLGVLEKGRLFKVARVFGVVTVKVANAVGGIPIAVPTQVLLDWDLQSGLGTVGYANVRYGVCVSSRDERATERHEKRHIHTLEVPCSLGAMIASSPMMHGEGNPFLARNIVRLRKLCLVVVVCGVGGGVGSFAYWLQLQGLREP